MNGTEATDAVEEELVFESELDAPPDKVWRAVTVPELRDRWLPSGALADPEPIAATPGREVSYRLRDDEPPFLESAVVFQVRPSPEGEGTRLTIIHRFGDESLRRRLPVAANSNWRCSLRAA